MSGAEGFIQDKTLNKVAICSAVFAGFAYVGYSYARTAFCRKLACKNLENEDETRLQVSHIIFRRLSQSTQTDAILGNLDLSAPGRLIFKPRTVQDRIRELNVKARQFTDAFVAIQAGNGFGSNAITRNFAMHGPNSVQCSPWNSPRLLSPVDVRHLITSQSTENLTCLPPDESSRPKWVRKNSRRQKYEIRGSSNSKIRLEEEALALLQKMPEELILRLEMLSNQSGVLTPFEAKSLVALLYSPDRNLKEKALVTIANCAAFSVNLDFFREVGCIHRLCSLLKDEEIRLCAVQTLGNVILSEENIKQAQDCLPLLMDFILSNNNEEGLKLASLIVLTNLATTTDWHDQYSSIINRLYQLVDSTNPHMQLQSLRLLINLSCNRDMISFLLSAEGPQKLEKLVSMDTSDAVLLRALTLLAILANAVKQNLFDNLVVLTSEEKVYTQDSMYSCLYGTGIQDHLVSNAQSIMLKHEDVEICRQASKLFDALRE